VANFRHCPRISFEGLRKIKDNLNQDSQDPDRDSNQVPRELKSEALQFDLNYFVKPASNGMEREYGIMETCLSRKMVSGTERIQRKLIKSPPINVNCMLKRRFEIWFSLYTFIPRCASWKLLEKEYSCHK
jgi:hypothetical protein